MADLAFLCLPAVSGTTARLRRTSWGRSPPSGPCMLPARPLPLPALQWVLRPTIPIRSALRSQSLPRVWPLRPVGCAP